MTRLCFSAASARMRLWIRCDCTAPPPGEVIRIAPAGALVMREARSSVLSMPARFSPGRSGAEMPIAPDRRTTGTTVRLRRNRRKNSGILIGAVPLLVSLFLRRWRSAAISPSRVDFFEPRSGAKHRIDLRQEGIPLLAVQDQWRQQLERRAAAFPGRNADAMGRRGGARLDRQEIQPAQAVS